MRLPRAALLQVAHNLLQNAFEAGAGLVTLSLEVDGSGLRTDGCDAPRGERHLAELFGESARATTSRCARSACTARRSAVVAALTAARARGARRLCRRRERLDRAVRAGSRCRPSTRRSSSRRRAARVDARRHARDRQGDRGEPLARHRHRASTRRSPTYCAAGAPRRRASTAPRCSSRTCTASRRWIRPRRCPTRPARRPFVDAPPVPIDCDARRSANVAAGGARPRERARGDAAARGRDAPPRAPDRQQRVGRRGEPAPHGGVPIIANDPHLVARRAVDVLREAPASSRTIPSTGPMNVSGVDLPGRAVRDPRPERAHHLGRDDQPDGRHRRLPRHARARPSECRDATRSLASFCIESDGVLHPVEIEVVRRTSSTRSATASSTTSCDGGARLADPGAISFTVPFRSFGADRRHRGSGRCFARRRDRDDGADAPVHRLPRDRRGADLPALESRAESRRVPRRARGASTSARRTGPTPTSTATSATSRAPSCRCARDLEAGAVVGLPPVLRARRLSGLEQLGPRSGALAGPGDPVRDAARTTRCRRRESAERLLREREQRPGRHLARQRPAEPAPPRRSRTRSTTSRASYANGLRSGRITQLLRDRIDAGPEDLDRPTCGASRATRSSSTPS